KAGQKGTLAYCKREKRSQTAEAGSGKRSLKTGCKALLTHCTALPALYPEHASLAERDVN
ncbi:MAG TPA: hypothetical protein VKZ71_05260, partial [Burkholderiaceae bacterium]|nr:hypothetical protein [Burkholderiaceae bacterium]